MIHRLATLRMEEETFRANHPDKADLSEFFLRQDSAFLTHRAAVVDRIGAEYASKLISRAVMTMRDLTIDEASVVIGDLLNWSKKHKRR